MRKCNANNSGYKQLGFVQFQGRILDREMRFSQLVQWDGGDINAIG